MASSTSFRPMARCRGCTTSGPITVVTLRHGSKERQVRLEEVTGPTAASAAAAYYERESFARPYMDVPENPATADFAAKSELFPVFKVNA